MMSRACARLRVGSLLGLAAIVVGGIGVTCLFLVVTVWA